MGSKTQEETIKECGRQLDALYTHFGRFLYENIERENLYYCFGSENGYLEEEANALLQKMRYPLSPEEKIQARATEVDTAKLPAVIRETRQQKKEPAPEAAGDKEIKPIERRGVIEPYTKLMVALYETKKKLLTLKDDLNEFLSLALLHTSDAKTEGLISRLREVKNTIITLIGKNAEVVGDIMGRKKQYIEDNRHPPDVSTQKAEDEFLKNATADIKDTGKQIDTLVKGAIGLFEEIKHTYEKDLEAERLLRGKEPPSDKKAAATSTLTKADTETETLEEESEEKFEDGLLETASRKLKGEKATEEEKLLVLDTILRNVPNTAVSFLFDLIKDADQLLKKQLIDLLKKNENPILLGLYRRFISDENPFLRLCGITGLKRLDSEKANEMIMSAIEDPNPNIRRLIANCLNCSDSDSGLTALAKLANDSDEHVARIAIRKLGKVKSRLSFTNLISKLESPKMRIRKETIGTLLSMTGEDLGYRYSAPEPERRVSVKNWQKWWEKNKMSPHFSEEIKFPESIRAGKKAKVISPTKLKSPRKKK